MSGQQKSVRADGPPALLIPIRLRAYLLGRTPRKPCFSGFTYDFGDLGDPKASLDNGLFENREPEEPGVHLHWSLPEALVTGTQGDGQKSEDTLQEHALQYPLAPNRWMVVRLWFDAQSGQARGKTFWLESDALQTRRGAGFYNSQSPSWPHPETPNRPYRYLGRCIPGDTAAAGLAAVERCRLTAVSPVNPYFSAYYPHCRNVFGLYDDLRGEGLEGTELSYLVCGWYDLEGEQEPFSGVHSLQALQEHWRLTVDTQQWPNRTVCHGLLRGVRWEGAQVRYPTGIPDDPEPGEVVDFPVFSVGNTAAEALAALSGQGGRERLFHYCLQGMLPDLSQNLAQAERELHRTGFAAQDPARLAAIRPRAGGQNRPPAPGVMDRLARLRQRQRQQFDAGRRILQTQRSAFEAWSLYLLSDSKSWRTQHLGQINRALSSVKEKIGAWLTEQDQIQAGLQALELGEDFELAEEPDANYYTPADPVLVIKQLANTEGKVSGEVVTCRVTGQGLTSLSVRLPDGRKVQLLGRELCGPLAVSAPPPEEFWALVEESVLLSFAPALAQLAFRRAGIQPSQGEVDELARRIADAQNAAGPVHPAFEGTKPAPFALESYRPQWYPLYLEWRAYYYPDWALLSQSPDLSGWRLEDGNFTYIGDPSILLETPYPLSGRLLISDNACRQFQGVAAQHLRHNQALCADHRSESLLSQSLSGFHDLLMMRWQVPQALIQNDQELVHLLWAFQAMHPEVLGTSPLFDGLFSPIRGGFFAFEHVRLLDQLGRFQDVGAPDFYAGESMRAPGAPGIPHEAMLQPRLLQPARLSALWLCAGRGKERLEAGAVSTASPLCGFLMPNRLDYSLMVYGEEGRLWGSLCLTQTGTGVSWKSPPGQPRATVIPPEMDEELYAMLTALRDSGRQSLVELIQYINQMQFQIHPGPHRASQAEYVGRPMALARMQVKLELLGALEQYRHNGEYGDEPDPSCAASVSAAVFSLEIGRRADRGDGLLGFYWNGDYSKLHIYEGVCPVSQAYFCTGNRMPMPAAPEHCPDVVSVLMDPWTYCTLTPGILPAVALRLPEALVEQALDRAMVTYFSAPLLTPLDELCIPIPKRDDLDFRFLRMDGAGNWIGAPLHSGDRSAFAGAYPQTAVEGYIQLIGKEE